MGAAVSATDPDGDTLTYSLTGADAGSFTVDGDGQIKVAQGTNLDYETKTSYSVTVNVSDGKDATGGPDAAIDASVAVTINVTDVVETTATATRFFPYVISALILARPGDIGDAGLPEAEGGQGEFTYTLTGLPPGLSFDPDTRILSGSVAAGEYTLTYTATDEAGVEGRADLHLDRGGGPLRWRFKCQGSEEPRVTDQSGGVTGQSDDINWRRPNIRNLHVARTQSTEPAAPALTVTWNTPDMSRDTSGDNLTLEDIAQYELRHSKPGGGLTFILAMSKDTRRTVLSNLNAGHNYLSVRARGVFGRSLSRMDLLLSLHQHAAAAGGWKSQSHIYLGVGRQ